MPARVTHAVSSPQRSDSFRSERSDVSAANKRVSFQPRVDVKHIAQKAGQPVLLGEQQPYNVYKEPTSLTEVELAREAERIIQQVDQISCTVSPSAPAGRLLLPTGYETRSLERTGTKRNNNNQQPAGQATTGWTKTLPSITTKNQLMDRNVAVKKTNSKVNNVDPPITIVNHNGMTPGRKETITPPKYDSGIEMEGGGSLNNRPNVNLIVQQLTEEARQREVIRRQYQEELLRLAAEVGEVGEVSDPLAPRLPTLNLIEPDPQFGLTHNRNLPFSYTGGASPTRLSPLRSSAIRFPSPPRRPVNQQQQQQQLPDEDIVYAQVKVNRQQRSVSPERTTDKVSGKLNFQRQQSAEVIRQHLVEDGHVNTTSSMDRAKARFLFGDDGRNIINNGNSSNNNSSGMPYKYGNQRRGGDGESFDEVDDGQRYTTKIVIGEDRSAQQQHQQQRVFQYGDVYYKDRSVSPEPLRAGIQPVSSRIRTLEQRTGQPITTTSVTDRVMPASTRLIQEAERGRTAVRRHQQSVANNEFITSSRLVQQMAKSQHPVHDPGLDGQPPKPPVRVKKLSRERLAVNNNINTNSGSRVAFGKTKTVPWRPEASPESSPERFIPYHQQQQQQQQQQPMGTGTYRYQPRSITPSPERIVRVIHSEPESSKQEKIRRQRSKFLSVFLGSSNKNSASSSSNKPARVVQQPMPSHKSQPPVTRWTDDELDYPSSSSRRQASTGNQQFRVVHHHRDVGIQQPPPPQHQQHRRRESSHTDRTDTSESDEMHRAGAQRFKSQRQKSQSFNNLSGHYHPAGAADPVVILTEERRHHNETRPYASTNIIRNRATNSADREEIVTRTSGSGNSRPVRYFGDTDLESQPSAGYQRTGRYVPRTKTTVMRSASSAAGMGAVRRNLIQRNGNNGQPVNNGKAPVISSVNSSESDGSAMAGAAGGSAGESSQRSVYLHATTVADIPTVLPASKLLAARKKAQSREDMSALSGGSSGSGLRRTQRHISRSYSVLAPWKPRHYRDKYEISYSNQQQPANIVNDAAAKPPRAPRVQHQSRREDVIMEDDGYDPHFHVQHRPAQPLQQHRQVAQPPPPSTTTTAKVSRSATMPKSGSKVAGWFRSKKSSSKQPQPAR